MHLGRTIALTLFAATLPAFASVALASDKPVLPTYILRARTVAIMVDPDAGIDIEHPNANQDAQRDVESAILAWGRFTPVIGAEQADLVIVLRKGAGKLAQQTVSDPRQNGRPGSVTTAPGSIDIGVQHGPQPSITGNRAPAGTQNGAGGAHSQTEIGQTNDSFTVYQGNITRPPASSAGDSDAPLDTPPAWRWTRKDALHPHDVPAVAEFRKAIAEAEKQAAKHP